MAGGSRGGLRGAQLTRRLYDGSSPTASLLPPSLRYFGEARLSCLSSLADPTFEPDLAECTEGSRLRHGKFFVERPADAQSDARAQGVILSILRLLVRPSSSKADGKQTAEKPAILTSAGPTSENFRIHSLAARGGRIHDHDQESHCAAWRPRHSRCRFGCCQYNRNLSPIDEPVAGAREPQATRFCHSTNAAERLVLYVWRSTRAFQVEVGRKNRRSIGSKLRLG